MDRFGDYCAQVCALVHCRFVHKDITDELRAHLEDHAYPLREGGATWDEADGLAIAAMGDPAEVGRGLDQLYPAVWYWVARILTVGVGLLLATVLVLATMHMEQWEQFRLWPSETAEEYLSTYLIPGPPCNERIVATGTVTGGGRLGDYSLRPGTKAQLVESPPYTSNGYDFGGEYKLNLVLEVAHWQPWLPTPHSTDWGKPSATDGAGDLSVVVYPQRQSPFLDYLRVWITPLDPNETHYTVSLTGADGRALSFQVVLDDWEVTP